jgi:hypothetical protein
MVGKRLNGWRASRLTLALFVTFVGANDADHTAPPHHLAVLAQFPN